MKSAPTIREIIESFTSLIDASHALLNEENRVLKEGQGHTAPALLDRKRVLIAEMESLLEACSARVDEASQEERSRISRLQARLMNLLVLDRENERMLLQSTLPRQRMTPGNPLRMANSYRKACAGRS